MLISFGYFYVPIKDYIAKVRVHATKDYEEDFYISIEKNLKVIIGKCNISETEFNAISKFIADNLDVLLEYWSSKGQMDGRDLYIKLGLYEEQKMEDELFFRSTISPRESNLKTNIYLMCNGINSVWAPEPKVKVQLRNAETFTILLEPNVRPTNIEQYNKLETENKDIVDNAIKYIKANKDIFLRYWNGKFEEYELHNILKARSK